REPGDPEPCLGIVFGESHQHPDTPHALGLLCARCERPRNRRGPNHFDEIAASHCLSLARDRAGVRLRPSKHERVSSGMGTLPQLALQKPRSAHFPKGSKASPPAPPERRRMIAVGTAVTSRPPHRSVRAEFPHTAPTLGVTAWLLLQLSVYAPAPVTRLPGSVPGPCFAGSHSPRPPPFAPPAPQRIAPFCSSASQLLWQSLTSRDRASSATAPRLPDADRRLLPSGRSRDLPVPTHGASAHARVSDHAGSSRRPRWRAQTCCLPQYARCRHPGKGLFRGSMAGLCAPLSTLRRSPRGPLRMTRGRCGSLLLHRKGLAPSTPCRSPGASHKSSPCPQQPISEQTSVSAASDQFLPSTP